MLDRAAKVIACLTMALFFMTSSILLISVRPRVVRVLDETALTVQTVREAAQLEAALLKDPRNRKAIEAGLQTLAVYNATGRLINRQVIPRAMKVLDEVEGSVRQMRMLTQDVNSNLNVLLPEIAATAKTLNVSVESVGAALVEITKEGKLTVEDIREIVSDPSWREALASIAVSSKNAEQITSNITGITENLEKTTAEMPSIAKSVEQIAKTSSKYRKALVLAQIIAVLTAAVI